jgi:Protein of unknown function (DUF3298)
MALCLVPALLLATGSAASAADRRPIVTPQVLRQADPHRAWLFTYRYPQISVPGALTGVQRICRAFNQKIERQAQRSLEEFEKEVARNASAAVPIAAQSRRDVDYSVATRRPGLLVLKYTQFEYLRGMAHPVTTIFTQNFDMRGRFLALPDLFTPNSGYLEKIAVTVERGLRAQSRSKGFKVIAPQGYAARVQNFQSFLIRRSGLEFLVSPYQVAPGYVGVLSATVPWGTLEGDLSHLGRQMRRAAQPVHGPRGSRHAYSSHGERRELRAGKRPAGAGGSTKGERPC